MQGQAQVGILAKAFGNSAREEVGSISVQYFSLVGYVSEHPRTPGRRAHQDEVKPPALLGKCSDGLEDWAGAEKAAPTGLVIRGHTFFHDVRQTSVSFSAADRQLLLQRHSRWMPSLIPCAVQGQASGTSKSNPGHVPHCHRFEVP